MKRDKDSVHQQVLSRGDLMDVEHGYFSFLRPSHPALLSLLGRSGKTLKLGPHKIMALLNSAYGDKDFQANWEQLEALA